MIERKTILSADRKYRYTLWRGEENPTAKFVQFIGLNPSTADEKNDDPTIRRCIDFAKRWGYDALCMTNLFAYRATLPADMKAFSSSVGLDNRHYLLQCASHAGLVIAAWGTNGKHQHQDLTVRQWLDGIGIKLHHLGLNGDGTPKHPLYLKQTTMPKPWLLDIKE